MANKGGYAEPDVIEVRRLYEGMCFFLPREDGLRIK